MRARLTPVDASFLRLESASAHMHVGWSALLAPRADRARPSVELLREHVAARLHRAPRARQRLAFPALGLGEPRWVDDPAFEPAAHVSAASGPEEVVTLERFGALRDAFLSRPLERRRPLWEVCLVPRLRDGRAGVVGKMHHAMVDGLAAVELALLLFDLDDPARGRDDPVVRAPPSAARLAAEALAGAAVTPLRAARETGRLLARPRGRSAALAATLRRAALAVREDLLPPAPRSALNVPIGPQRTLVGHRAELELAQRARRPAGVTLNDVCLAAIAGALRRLALERGEQPRALKTMVPVSVRTGGDRDTPGNRISLAFIDLPVDAAAPAERRARVRAQTRRFKQAGRPDGTAALLAATGQLPIPLRGPLARAAAGARMYNLTISNVPGPKIPVTVLGAELTECYPVVPIADDHALAIGILSYRDHVFFGLYADPHALPDVERLPAALDRELHALAGRTPSPRRARRAHLTPVA